MFVIKTNDEVKKLISCEENNALLTPKTIVSIVKKAEKYSDCPLSKKTMKDPVILNEVDYERNFIADYHKEHNSET